MKKVLFVFFFLINISGVFSQTPEIVDLGITDTDTLEILRVFEVDDDIYFYNGSPNNDFYKSELIKLKNNGEVQRKIISEEGGCTSIEYVGKNGNQEIVIGYRVSDKEFEIQMGGYFKICFAKMDSNLNFYDTVSIVLDSATTEQVFKYVFMLEDVNHQLSWYSYTYNKPGEMAVLKKWSFYRFDMNRFEFYRKDYFEDELPFNFDETVQSYVRRSLLHNPDSTGYYFYGNSYYHRFDFDKDFNYLGRVDLAINHENLVDHRVAYINGTDGSVFCAGGQSIGDNYYRSVHIAKFNDEPRWVTSFSGPEPKYTDDYPAWWYPVDNSADREKIFFGCNLLFNWQNPSTPTYWGLYCFDMDLNLISEYFYHHEGNPEQMMLFVFATSDGGCMVGGFYRYEYGPYNSLILKFPPETFVSIEEAHRYGLTTAIAYPNPGNDKMCIRTALADAQIEVFDMTGKLVEQQKITDSETVLDATIWQSGTYVWRVLSEGKLAETGKWIKR